MTSESLSFEQTFQRLEEILEKMNSGKTPLEESLKLFEEAEKLIRSCNAKLTAAEQKIEVLVKQRGELILDEAQKPKTEPFGKNHEIPF
jgi:exodeoxyribonuclease VII small subunit